MMRIAVYRNRVSGEKHYINLFGMMDERQVLKLLKRDNRNMELVKVIE
jgi:hypothetical protein